ncbi:MAG: hypothetical protein EA353_11705 [Puniceicoccaceae bacterium]|nr:MAG: hypothetical protein EA353_11705 [Puniceicoccaceae bacterium]
MPQRKARPIASPDAQAATKPKRAYRTADQWREIVEAYQRSNLTRAEFCMQWGIAGSGLYKWQRRFEQERCSQPRHEEAFIEIAPPSVGTSHQLWDVELELGHGRVLRVRIA